MSKACSMQTWQKSWPHGKTHASAKTSWQIAHERTLAIFASNSGVTTMLAQRPRMRGGAVA